MIVLHDNCWINLISVKKTRDQCKTCSTSLARDRKKLSNTIDGFSKVNSSRDAPNFSRPFANTKSYFSATSMLLLKLNPCVHSLPWPSGNLQSYGVASSQLTPFATRHQPQTPTHIRPCSLPLRSFKPAEEALNNNNWLGLSKRNEQHEKIP